MLPVSCLCAFLCLAVLLEPLPLASYTPFAGHNSLSAFTAIVKDHVAMFLGVLVSLTMPLASVAAGCKRVPKVSVSSKGFEHKWKGDIICVPFLQQNNIPKSVFRMSRSFYHSNLDTLPTVAGSALTLLTRRYHKNRGSMMSLELFAINCWDLGQVGQICWCHSGDLYAFWPCHVQHACNISWFQSLVPFIDGGLFHLFLLDLLLLQSSRRHCKVVTVPWEIMWCSKVFRFAELQCHDGREDLPLSL
jgi:hypothetical protein